MLPLDSCRSKRVPHTIIGLQRTAAPAIITTANRKLSMALKLGDWKLNLNGLEGTLSLKSVDVSGSVTGTLSIPISGAMSTHEVVGLWDETSRKISLTFVPSPTVKVPAVFEAVVFSTPFKPEPRRDVAWTMVGFCHAVDLPLVTILGGNAKHNTFGWFANIIEVV